MISVIVPVYNAEKYLRECLESIQKQSYSEFEVICVDDGSLDCSSNICQNFVDADTRFFLINQENKGVSAARNSGLASARGEYVCFIDADDIIDSEYLAKLNELSEGGYFSLCSYTRDINQLGLNETKVTDFTRKEFVESLIYETIEHPGLWLMLFNNDIIKRSHLLFHEGCIRNEDYEFYLKYIMFVEQIRYTNYKGYYYRTNNDSVMHVTTMKSLTSLDASKRIGTLLCNNNYTDNINIDLYPSLQSLVYHLGREKNKGIYDFIHNEYNIRSIMKELLSYKPIKRKVVSIFYLFLGRRLFFSLLSSRFSKWMPL